MPYTPQTWVTGPGGGTPVSAERLNYMEDGIHEVGGNFSLPVGADKFTVVQGSGSISIDPASNGWLDVRRVSSSGGALSVLTAWINVLFAAGTAGESGQPIRLDCMDFMADIGTEFGLAFRGYNLGNIGLPIGHVVALVGGALGADIYHCIKKNSTRLLFAEHNGTLLGTEAGLIEGDFFDIQLNCFIYSD